MKRYTKNIERRKMRIRAKIVGRKNRPRLSVFRSGKGIYAQLIDDSLRKTLLSVSWKEITVKNSPKLTKTQMAEKIGELLAQKAKVKKISSVIFDRGGNKYHGRVKAIAEGARKGGLQF